MSYTPDNRRVAMIVNDMSKVNIDAALAGHSGQRPVAFELYPLFKAIVLPNFHIL